MMGYFLIVGAVFAWYAIEHPKLLTNHLPHWLLGNDIADTIFGEEHE